MTQLYVTNLIMSSQLWVVLQPGGWTGGQKFLTTEQEQIK